MFIQWYYNIGLNWLGTEQAKSHYLSQLWLVYWRINASHGLSELRGIEQIS